MTAPKPKLGHRLTDLFFRGFLRMMLALPLETRLHLTGKLTSNILAPLTGSRRRIRNNLALAMPELPADEVKRLTREVPYHMGRSVMEIYSHADLKEHCKTNQLTGPGVPALQEAQATGRGVMIITGHIGSYVAARYSMQDMGFTLGALYKPMRNPAFNAHYVDAMSANGFPMFEQSRRGLSEMVKHLRSGGMVAIVLDQRINSAPILSFMDKPARTALSAAEMALKYDALVIPGYGIRNPDNSFTITAGAPIPHTTAAEMTQALNDHLAAEVRNHPEQWMWTHNRWKNAGNDTADELR
ncbi:lysophospholipid acyltransferase family protein [Shimia abyssi]|uniref:KDO2-lipid IV(A) lauroyltransferase n=1 Tax=Shimia abyssi TaxID=1662395 RepID=A0A2P8FCM3_9RHOB|nr:lysophospholipid acyltransferase family protein [Shimia abyssi]PSL19442.1 KDO2-lipid IV(A) lauroyltransferase [Shimia abyssi]